MASNGGQDRMLVNALKSQPSLLNLSNKSLYIFPPIIGDITSIKSLILKTNYISDIGLELSLLTDIEHLNLGNNKLRNLPSVFQYLKSLLTLHLFNNVLEVLTPTHLVGLKNLHLLNLNNNRLKVLPAEIDRLPYLEILSLDNNFLTELPIEICHLSELKELHVNNNCLKSIPHEVAFLQKLRKLCVHKNQLQSLPVGLCQCKNLDVVDVAGNMIQSFPAQILKLNLSELHCECNNLLQHLAVRSTQQPEVLSLKEQSARTVITALKESTSDMRKRIQFHPDIEEMCKVAAECDVCRQPFLDTWLECVRFVDGKKVLRTKNNTGTIPIRGLLCSYVCFNTSGHDFYGIAQTEY